MVKMTICDLFCLSMCLWIHMFACLLESVSGGHVYQYRHVCMHVCGGCTISAAVPQVVSILSLTWSVNSTSWHSLLATEPQRSIYPCLPSTEVTSTKIPHLAFCSLGSRDCTRDYKVKHSHLAGPWERIVTYCFKSLTLGKVHHAVISH